MKSKLFSDKNRPVHMGRYPLEKLKRLDRPVNLDNLNPWPHLSFEKADDPASIIPAMAEFQAMMDAVRDGVVTPLVSDIPDDVNERLSHLKAFCYFNDMAMVGIGPLGMGDFLDKPRRNPEIDRLAHALKTRQTKTLAAGIDLIMADLKDSMEAAPGPIDHHRHALVFAVEYRRDPGVGEVGCDWIQDAQAHRAALLATENATVIASYLRVLGFDARAHSATTAEVDLARLAVNAGLAIPDGEDITIPWLGRRFGLAAVTTNMDLAHDRVLDPQQPASVLNGKEWRFGTHGGISKSRQDPYAKRAYHMGAHPFETLKRVETPTTYIDEPNVARVPKRADLFARAQFGDMGAEVQKGATAGRYVRKAAPSSAQRRLLGAFVLLQDGPVAGQRVAISPHQAADNIKAASYFLGSDATGLCRCPDWAWYSHDARGDVIEPPHDQSINMVIDQGYETMEGASGDDWIGVAQSMRAYLRFSLLGGILAQHIRNLGYGARAHTVMDGEVLQPPLLLLSGLGEVSRIGEVILNPFLGPRLKSGTITTDLPLHHDQPIDFGLQTFCNSCNKCARECPSGAITAGPKLMFNGYEIWKSDSQKCATYRITTPGGAMCGRCMKTCPWNLEGLFAEAPFRWAAMTAPQLAPVLARLDDAVGHGRRNPVKKWWWDLELTGDGNYSPTPHPVNERDLQPELKVAYEDQTLAVYPANLAPPPHPYPSPMDRDAGVEAYQAMITAEVYQARAARGALDITHRYTNDQDPPVLQMVVDAVETLANVKKYTLRAHDGADLPVWEAGAHLDIVVAPEFLRQYSMCGDPGDRSCYQIAVLEEPQGRGGSQLMHRIFEVGRKVFVSKPINHFPLVETAKHTLLFGGGIGVTPMIAFAHRLHALGKDFTLYYSAPTRENAAFDVMLRTQPWAANLRFCYSDEGTRLNLEQIPKYKAGTHLYTCGPEGYMSAIQDRAADMNYPETAVHFEYFSAPEVEEKVNYPFTIQRENGDMIEVARDQRASDALILAGVPVDIKCSDGLCGVCKCTVLDGAVDHRDFVLTAKQREGEMILCQSRASHENAILRLKI